MLAGRFTLDKISPLKSNVSVILRASLELMRPANIITALADILAGASAATAIILLSVDTGFLTQPAFIGLLISTCGLYGGGVVFNDVFDADLDSDERPERAIPSGRVSKLFAVLLGSVLFAIGILAAFWVNNTAGILAIGITAFALIYDFKAKHHVFFGPLFMGICRGGNLMLGASIIPASLQYIWPLALLPVFYIGAITLISQGEVHGGSKGKGILATAIVVSVTGVLLILSLHQSYYLISAAPFAILFGVMVIPPFVKAVSDTSPGTIKTAVKRGVLSLIILNSALAAGFAGYIPGLIVLALLPISILFAKLFAVT